MKSKIYGGWNVTKIWKSKTNNLIPKDGTATGYGLHNQGVGIRVLVGRDFSLLRVVQTVSEVLPTSCPMFMGGKGASFPRVKRQGREAGHSPPPHIHWIHRPWLIGVVHMVFGNQYFLTVDLMRLDVCHKYKNNWFSVYEHLSQRFVPNRSIFTKFQLQIQGN
jgi:hypothetical protein